MTYRLVRGESSVVGGAIHRGKATFSANKHAVTLWQDRLVLLLTWIAACWPWLRATGFTNGDNVAFFYPQSSFVVSSLRRGEAPWWNPYLYGGQPALGDPQSMIFTPHTLAGFLLGQHFNLHTYDITSHLCILMGGFAVHRYGMRYADRRLWPLLGALVFMFGGVASSRMQHVAEIISYSLLPWLLLTLRAACERPTLPRAVALALFCLADILNPNQVVFLSAPVLLPFFIYHATTPSNRLRATVICGLAGLAALIAAVPMLQAMAKFLAASNRPALPLAASNGFSFSMIHLPGLLLPGLFGMAHNTPALWSPTDADMDYLYIGILPACLVLWSLISLPRLHVPALIALCMAVTAFIFALGPNAPLYPYLFAHIPGFSGFRRPADAAFLMNFLFAVLLAVCRPFQPLPAYSPGWTHLLVPGTRISWRVSASLLLVVLLMMVLIRAGSSLNGYAASVGQQMDLLNVTEQAGVRFIILCVAAPVMVLGGRFSAPIASALAFLLSGYDLCSAGRFHPVHFLPYDASIVARIYRHSPPDELARAVFDTIDFLDRNAGLDDPHGSRIEVIGGALGLTMPEVERLQATHGYNPAVLRTFADAVGAQTLTVDPKTFRPDANGYDSEVYRTLGLHFVLFDQWTMHDTNGPAGVAQRAMQIRTQLLALGSSAARYRGVIGAYEIWEMLNAYPKARLVPSGSEAIPCKLTHFSNNDIGVLCHATRPATLVIGENDAPGWSACVNGVVAPIVAYAGLLRSVAVPAGDDHITLRYRPIPSLHGSGCRS